MISSCHLYFSPGSLQATRALMIVGIIMSIAGLGVACMGMKCTTCGGTEKLRKSRIAMTGGIILLVGGEDVPQTSTKHYGVFSKIIISDFLTTLSFSGWKRSYWSLSQSIPEHNTISQCIPGCTKWVTRSS